MVSRISPASCGRVFIASVGTLATLSWIGMGVLIRDFYVKHYRVINIVLALTLGECIYSMLR